MTCLLMPIFSGNSITRSVEKILVDLVYLVGTLINALFYCNAASWEAWERWTFIPSAPVATRVITSMTKLSEFSSKILFANSFFLMTFIRLVGSKVPTVVYDLQIRFFVSKLMLALLRDKKGMSNTIPMRVLASKTISLKNRSWLFLS